MAKKKWTVMMYLNGNNELGIEMENTFKEVCKIKNSEGMKEAQIFYISEDEIEEVLRPYLKASEN